MTAAKPPRKRKPLTPEQKAKKREQGQRYYIANKEKICARTNAYHAANRDKRLSQQKEYALRTKYSLTPEGRDALFAAQGSVCPCCKRDTPPTKIGWVVDHCHETGRVRGVLCSPCNSLLGHAGDNPQTLANAILYLNQGP